MKSYSSEKPKVIAFLLPQFHQIPENDNWWGAGFTEWTNVKKAKSRYSGHRQPRVPRDNNYYDILDTETQSWQANLAKSHGIHGFCYYHYWFSGRQLLQKPVEKIMRDKEPDLPFCLAWANEPWTRAWDGEERDVLMPQSYGETEDWNKHYDYLEPIFLDERYIKIDGKPVILIYRSASIKSCKEMLDLWRARAVASGFQGLHVISMMTFYQDDSRRELFDAYTKFEPVYTQRHLPFTVRAKEAVVNRTNRLIWRIFGKGLNAPRSLGYQMVWNQITSRKMSATEYPGAFVDWDNSPRKELSTSLVMRDAKPSIFAKGFRSLYLAASRAGSPFIFVNAWNEWAEGTYLEPDEEHGTSYLEAIRDVVRDSKLF